MLVLCFLAPRTRSLPLVTVTCNILRDAFFSRPTHRMAERHKLLLESPQLQEEEVPHLSANSSSGSYVLSITSLPSYYCASTSAPANVIDLFDKTTLKCVQTIPGHELAITSLHSVDNVAGSLDRCLISSGRDGSIKIWDNRSNSHSIKSECLSYGNYELSDSSMKSSGSDEFWEIPRIFML